MKTCDKCIHANWNRTSNGRLHPDKGGKCAYEYPAHPPLSNAHHWGWSGQEKPPTPSGGYIQRGREFKTQCPYWSAAK